MIDEAKARALAEVTLEGSGTLLDAARETEQAWFFSSRPPDEKLHGVFVNKRTGRVLHASTKYPLERALAMYERGYQFPLYDFVVTAVHDLDATERALARLPIRVREPTYEHGQVWRVAREMTREDRLVRLSTLPCIFTAVQLYEHLEVLEEARDAGWFEFVALACRWRRPEW